MDYEDDFSWRDLDYDADPQEHQEHQNLLVVRFLIENGYIPDQYDGAPPPASKEVVKNLEERKVQINRTGAEKSPEKCVICLKLDATEPDDDEENITNQIDKDACNEKIFKVMPCGHAFHSECLLPWLEKTNSCPMCRYELKTDDANYERLRAERQRAQQREKDIETLHNSMFG
ncbi:E3 ubiquitin-protein ligase RNF181-like [Contarinia nasturtii]|uniref:E3 ubiquitin-protein ligase RNF181-like n=1 Tax=Contarinia nasturtii TaxID=265458 RepID=UPI0012D3780D|nr:E3 ubiquitin-protein ligase RNF181-like [Contarinia nasturtii]